MTICMQGSPSSVCCALVYSLYGFQSRCEASRNCRGNITSKACKLFAPRLQREGNFSPSASSICSSRCPGLSFACEAIMTSTMCTLGNR